MLNIRLVIIVCVSLGICWSSSWHWAQTIDEPQHLWSGTRILQQFDFSRFDNSKMPVSVLNSVGWLWSQSPGAQGSWFWARVPQALWLVGLVVVVFCWGRRLGTRQAALAVAALVAFDPNLLAHAGVVTTDLPCAFAVVLSCFLWSRLLEMPNRKWGIGSGLAIGFAQATKFTALFLGPILALMALFWCVFHRTMAPLRQLPVVIASALLALNLAYGFSGTGTAGRDIVWKSDPFRVLAESAIPLPVPKPWIEGVDWVKNDDDAGQGRVYSQGQKSHFGRADHYLRTLPRKWALPVMVLGLAGLFVAVRRRERWSASMTTFVPPAFFLLWFSLAFNSQVGNRYVLPALPFVALWAVRLPIRWLAVGVVWTLMSTLSWWPWGLSYFNETVLDRSQAWRIVADSDLDWGQTDFVAQQWLSENPDGHWNPDVPMPGPVLLSANRLTGVLGHPTRFACIRDQLAPTEHLAGALYPMSWIATDFERCFPVVHLDEGEGTLPPGNHLLIARFQGRARLAVGGHVQTANTQDESLLGLVVHAESNFSAEWTLPENGTVYLNGKPIEGSEVAE